MEQNLLSELTKRLQQGELTEQEENEILSLLPEIKKEIEENKKVRINKKNIAYTDFCEGHENKAKIYDLYKERNEIDKVLNKFSKKWTVFSVLYSILLFGGGITFSILFPLLNVNIGITLLSIIAFVAGGIALIKPIAKLYSKKYKKHILRHSEISEEIATLNNEMWEEFNSQYEREQTNVQQVAKKSESLKLVNVEEEISL